MLNVRDFSQNKEVKPCAARNTTHKCVLGNNMRGIFTI